MACSNLRLIMPVIESVSKVAETNFYQNPQIHASKISASHTILLLTYYQMFSTPIFTSLSYEKIHICKNLITSESVFIIAWDGLISHSVRVLSRLRMVGSSPQLRFRCGLLQEDFSRVVGIHIPAQWKSWWEKSGQCVSIYIGTNVCNSDHPLTHVSSFHPPVSEQLAVGPCGAQLHEQDKLLHAGYTASQLQLDLRTEGQKFHIHLPWTRSWMNVLSKEPCAHPLEPPVVETTGWNRVFV